MRVSSNWRIGLIPILCAPMVLSIPVHASGPCDTARNCPTHQFRQAAYRAGYHRHFINEVIRHQAEKGVVVTTKSHPQSNRSRPSAHSRNLRGNCDTERVIVVGKNFLHQTLIKWRVPFHWCWRTPKVGLVTPQTTYIEHHPKITKWWHAGQLNGNTTHHINQAAGIVGLTYQGFDDTGNYGPIKTSAYKCPKNEKWALEWSRQVAWNMSVIWTHFTWSRTTYFKARMYVCAWGWYDDSGGGA